jgi:hypothetical protein
MAGTSNEKRESFCCSTLFYMFADALFRHCLWVEFILGIVVVLLTLFQ